jgi:hypothetical protein
MRVNGSARLELLTRDQAARAAVERDREVQRLAKAAPGR